MPELWAGTDAGKAAHHCTVIDADGTKVLSRRVPNNESELLELLGDVLVLAEECPVTWAVDLNAGGGTLLIALLVGHGQRLLYIPGRTVHHASRGYRGDGKTDWEDYRGRGVLRLVGPKDRSASCLVSDASVSWRTPLRGAGRARCGLIGA